METAADLRPYLPRIAIDWLARTPERTAAEVDGSIAFVDISGFTKLSERLARRGKVGAEELTDAIGRCFEELLAVAYANGGSLIKFGGDALLLLFTGDDHAVRASHSAFGMRAALRRIGRLSTPAGQVRLRMSVGAHTGRFAFFFVGSRHRELLITGPAATQTVLMEQAAEAGEIVVSPQMAAALPSGSIGDPKGPGFLLRTQPGASGDGDPAPRARDDTDVAEALPVEIREHVMGGGSEPEHRLATVTFIRFEGADAAIASQGAESFAARLEMLVSSVQDAAAEHAVTFLGSDVDRDGGKIILAAGAPRATGADEEAALIVARKVVESGPTMPIKIGVNRGHVFAGEIGPSYRRTYTVMGDTVNLAARLMAAAHPGGILAPAAVLDRSRTSFATIPLPPFSVKGKAKPVHAFEVGAAVHPAAGATAGRSEEGTPLVGRTLELAELRALAEDAREGRGHAVRLSGAPGMGVSRLVTEVRRGAPDLAAFGTSGGPYAASSPYFPFRSLLRDILDVPKELPPLEAAEHVRARVAADAPDLLPWLPLIGVAMDLPFPATPETEALGEEFRRHQLETVIVDLVSVAVKVPSLLVFEDTHYFDTPSSDLLAALAAVAPERPWLVATTLLEGRDGPALPHTVRTIVVGPLAPEEARALAEALTEQAPLPEYEIDSIVDRSGGNPLVVRALIDAARSGGAEGLPDSVEALMAARIDRLPPSDRSLLRTASVLGTTFDAVLLDALVDDGAPAADDAVWERLAQYLAPSEGGYRFVSPLMRDAAYEGLTYRRRRALHARAGESLLRAAPRVEEIAELLALHFFNAGRIPETWRFARLAGDRARAKYANVEAARFFTQALEAARKLPETPPSDLVVVHEAMGDVLNLAGEFKKAELAYRNARRAAADDDVSDARLLLKEAQIADRLGRLSVALLRLSRGRALLEGLDTPEAAAQRAQISSWYAAVRQEQGHHRDAIRWCTRTIAEAEAAGERKALAYGHQILDWALDSVGEAGDRSHLTTALAIYEELGDLKGQGIVLNNLGIAAYWEGRWNDALDFYERGRLAHERIGDPSGAAGGLYNIAEILSDQGRQDEAEPLLRRVLRVTRAAGEQDGVAYAFSQLGRVAARRRRFEEADALYAQAKEIFASIGSASSVLETDLRIAERLVLEGQAEKALELLDDVTARDPAQGPLTPLLLRTRGYALAQSGRMEEARAAFDASLESATARGSDYEAGFTLRAIAALAEQNGSSDPASAGNSAEILARLGVVETTDPPL